MMSPLLFCYIWMLMNRLIELYKKVSEGAFRDLYINWDDTVRIMKDIYKDMIKKKQA